MLRPSYAELMEILNKESEGGDEVTSRYNIVIAAAKRARQLIDGDEPMVEEIKGKPVSTAVAELAASKIKIVPEGEGTVLKPKKNEGIKNIMNEEMSAVDKEIDEDFENDNYDKDDEMKDDYDDFEDEEEDISENGIEDDYEDFEEEGISETMIENEDEF